VNKATNIKIIGPMEDKLYRAMPELSQSDLAWLKKSPRHFQLRSTLRKESEAMDFGTRFHMAVLEPARFKEMHVCEPDKILGELVNKRKPAHREYLEQWALENVDKIICTSQQLEDITVMIQELAANKAIRDLLTGGTSECVATWTYRGVRMKGKADVHNPNSPFGNTLVDLKKTRSAWPHDFARSIHNYDYDYQCYAYSIGFGASRSFIVAAEDKPPYGVGVYDMEAWQDLGQQKLDHVIDIYLRCMESGEWPSYTSGAELLVPPKWLQTVVDAEEEVLP
jgi:hypothetical protein